jgi:hypothetical protein
MEITHKAYILKTLIILESNIHVYSSITNKMATNHLHLIARYTTIRLIYQTIPNPSVVY